MTEKNPLALPAELDHVAFNRNEIFAAKFLGIDPETLRGWRRRSKGPQFRRIGGRLIRYSVQSLMAFVESQPSGGQA